MTQGVNEVDVAASEEQKTQPVAVSDKELNFRRLEAAREQERERAVRAEMQAEAMRNELNEIKQMLQPKESDPLDGAEDYVDPARLRAKLDKERAHFKKEAKAIAKQTYEEERKEDERKNFLPRLKSQFPDYDQVMNETNIAALEQADPVFVETLMEVSDEYSRRSKAYKKIKALQAAPKPEEKSIKAKVEENARNPYYMPPSTATPAGIDFDVGSKVARDAAYAKLKAAQKNLNNVQAAR